MGCERKNTVCFVEGIEPTLVATFWNAVDLQHTVLGLPLSQRSVLLFENVAPWQLAGRVRRTVREV